MDDARKALRVFISYARRDAASFAEELLYGLEVAGFEGFLDRHDIAAGEDWEARLGGLIQSADTVVFVVSPASVASERCAWEVNKAEAISKRIIPVVAEDVPETQTPHGLKRLNYIFFTKGHSFTKALSELATALRVDIDWIREHTRLGDLARRWQDRGRVEAMLLRGEELEAARLWLGNWKPGAPEPTDAQRALLNESSTAESTLIKRERARQRGLRLGLGIAAVIFGALAVTAGTFAWRANEAAHIAEQRALAEQIARQSEARALAQATKSADEAKVAQTNAEANAKDATEKGRLAEQRATEILNANATIERAGRRMADDQRFVAERLFALADSLVDKPPTIGSLEAAGMLYGEAAQLSWYATWPDAETLARGALGQGGVVALKLAGLKGSAKSVDFECDGAKADPEMLAGALEGFSLSWSDIDKYELAVGAACTFLALARPEDAEDPAKKAISLATNDAERREAQAMLARSQRDVSTGKSE